MDPAHASVMAAKPHYLSFEIVRSAVSILPMPLRFIAFISFFLFGAYSASIEMSGEKER